MNESEVWVIHYDADKDKCVPLCVTEEEYNKAAEYHEAHGYNAPSRYKSKRGAQLMCNLANKKARDDNGRSNDV